jgi:hypothetical protein
MMMMMMMKKMMRMMMMMIMMMITVEHWKKVLTDDPMKNLKAEKKERTK